MAGKVDPLTSPGDVGFRALQFVPVVKYPMVELKRTTASMVTAIAKLIGAMLLISVVANWGRPIDYTLAIPMLIIPAFVWFAFVPRRFRYGKEGFEFTSRFSGVHFLPSDGLRHWGQGQGTWLLEFDQNLIKRRTLQIALWFYPRTDREEFLKFLKEKYPERQAYFWWGIRGYARRQT